MTVRGNSRRKGVICCQPKWEGEEDGFVYYNPQRKGVGKGDIPAEELDEVNMSLLGGDVGWNGSPLPLLVDVCVVLEQESGQL